LILIIQNKNIESLKTFENIETFKALVKEK